MGRKCSRTVHSHRGGCGWQAQADRADPRLLLLPHQDQHRAAWHPTEENQDVLLLLAVSHSAHAHVPNKVKNLSFPQKLSISPQKLIVQCAGQKRDYWNISRRFPRPRLSKIFSWQRGRLVRGFHQIHKMFMIDNEIHSGNIYVHNLPENNKHPPSRFRPYQFLLEHTGLTHAQFGKMRGKGTVISKPFIIPFDFRIRYFNMKQWNWNFLYQVTTYLEENNLIEPCVAWLEKNYPGERWW